MTGLFVPTYPALDRGGGRGGEGFDNISYKAYNFQQSFLEGRGLPLEICLATFDKSFSLFSSFSPLLVPVAASDKSRHTQSFPPPPYFPSSSQRKKSPPPRHPRIHEQKCTEKQGKKDLSPPPQSGEIFYA